MGCSTSPAARHQALAPLHVGTPPLALPVTAGDGTLDEEVAADVVAVLVDTVVVR